jgi:hypothetical protein
MYPSSETPALPRSGSGSESRLEEEEVKAEAAVCIRDVASDRRLCQICLHLLLLRHLSHFRWRTPEVEELAVRLEEEDAKAEAVVCAYV